MKLAVPIAVLGPLGIAACSSPPTRSVAPAPAPTQEEREAAGGSSEELAKQLANPIASLTSVPIQLNFDGDVGPAEGDRLTVNVQPVAPFSLNEDWNLISRTILPLIHQEDVPFVGEDELGLGDTVQSLFFSPVAPTEGGWIWGAGPVLLLPTGTDDALGADQWGVGPTGVALKQSGPWTYGALVNHLWGVAGDDDRPDVNATFVQPFVTYTTPSAWNYALNAEATYDWRADELALPINLQANKILNLGGRLIQVGGGLRYWLEDTDAGPEGWGLRLNLIFLFPR